RPRAVEEWRHRGNSRVVAFGGRNRIAFRGPLRTPSRARRLRSGPLAPLLPHCCGAASGAPRGVAAGIAPTIPDRDPIPVFRRHAGSFALVRCAPAFRQRWWIYRACTLLLFAGYDRER